MSKKSHTKLFMIRATYLEPRKKVQLINIHDICVEKMSSAPAGLCPGTINGKEAMANSR